MSLYAIGDLHLCLGAYKPVCLKFMGFTLKVSSL